MDMIVKQAIVQSVDANGANIKIRFPGETVDIVAVKNATGRRIIKGQRVLVHYRGGVLMLSDPAYITSILDVAAD